MRYRKSLLFFLGLGSLYMCAITLYGLSAKPEISDVAVVLGNKVLDDGAPSKRLQARLDCAVSVYRRNLTHKILVSGGLEKSGFDEATVMAQYLRHEGVPEEDILKDSSGVNTMATAVNTAALANTKHFSRILIVTQYYHIPRCLWAFYKAGLHALSADYPRYFEWDDFFATAREAVAIPVYFIKMSRKD